MQVILGQTTSPRRHGASLTVTFKLMFALRFILQSFILCVSTEVKTYFMSDSLTGG